MWMLPKYEEDGEYALSSIPLAKDIYLKYMTEANPNMTNLNYNSFFFYPTPRNIAFHFLF